MNGIKGGPLAGRELRSGCGSEPDVVAEGLQLGSTLPSLIYPLTVLSSKGLSITYGLCSIRRSVGVAVATPGRPPCQACP